MLNFTFHRQCETCQHIFASDRGYRHHLKANKTKPCGINAKNEVKKAALKKRNERRKGIKGVKLKNILWNEKMISKPRRRGVKLTKEIKENLLFEYDLIQSKSWVTCTMSKI